MLVLRCVTLRDVALLLWSLHFVVLVLCYFIKGMQYSVNYP